ncbi:DUF1223 domain-containing protein [Erythrobacter sp. NE805]|uniref:DUF1223 domain-containing protein n=1 Tax=Erythrobacter sp. NE805 TaxID=3389875 RepID=UPI00396B38E3
MTRTRTLLALVGGIAVLGGAALAIPRGAEAPAADPAIAASPERPVLVELFTSQGCSSCPPADALAEKLAREPGLVVISRAVTYWDRLGWKDTLAREGNTVLQQNYARAGLEGTNGVYTPQLVVGGAFGTVGSRAGEVAAGIKRHAPAGDAAIRVNPAEGGGYAARLSGTGAGKAELVLLAVTRHVEVAIGSGENGGRKVGYANVLRAERKLADWRGGAADIAVTPAELAVPGADRYALVLRQPGGGKVLAARWLA